MNTATDVYNRADWQKRLSISATEYSVESFRTIYEGEMATFHIYMYGGLVSHCLVVGSGEHKYITTDGPTSELGEIVREEIEGKDCPTAIKRVRATNYRV